MQKNRVILVVISLLVITGIYFLPRVVVDNEKNLIIGVDSEDTKTGVAKGENEVEMANVHSSEIPETDLNRIKILRSKIQNEGSDQLTFADSLSRLFISYNQYDSAAKYLEIIARIKPGIDQYENAGNAYFEALGFAMDKSKADSSGERARFYYNQILNLDPSRLDIKNKLAMTFISTSSPMQGISLLREILEEDSENEAALFNLGILAIQSGQYDRASERFKNLVSLYPQNLQGQFYLGLCFFELGEKDNARKQFELVRSMEEDPAVLATVEGYLKELN